MRPNVRFSRTPVGEQEHRQPSRGKWLCLPREHGSWGILLLPFASAAVLAGNPNLALLPALVAALAAFLTREPIVVLWKGRGERAAATRTLWISAVAFVICGLWLLSTLPIFWLVMLGGMAVILMIIHVQAVIHGQQRSITLQVVGAAGLSSSAVLAYLAGGREPDLILLLLWAAQTVYYTGSVMTIHTLIAARKHRAGTWPDRGPKRKTEFCLAAQTACAAAFALGGFELLGVALAVPVVVHVLDLMHMDDPIRRKIPLRNIGLRELGLSTVFSCLCVLSLW